MPMSIRTILLIFFCLFSSKIIANGCESSVATKDFTSILSNCVTKNDPNQRNQLAILQKNVIQQFGSLDSKPEFIQSLYEQAKQGNKRAQHTYGLICYFFYTPTYQELKGIPPNTSFTANNTEYRQFQLERESISNECKEWITKSGLQTKW